MACNGQIGNGKANRKDSSGQMDFELRAEEEKPDQQMRDKEWA